MYNFEIFDYWISKNVVEGRRKIGGETVAVVVRNSCNDYTVGVGGKGGGIYGV